MHFKGEKPFCENLIILRNTCSLEDRRSLVEIKSIQIKANCLVNEIF